MADVDALLDMAQDALRLELELLLAKIEDDKKFNERTSAQAQRLGRAVAALAAQARQREKDWAKRALHLSHEQKVEVMAEIFASLPPEFQAALRERIQAK